ncbi:MAG: PIN domain-containing protein [Armatimonadota bacterium]
MSSLDIYALDANVILRFVLGKKQPFYQQAKTIMEAVADGQVDVHLDPIILGEVVWVLSSFYELSPESIAEGLLPIIALDHLHLAGKDRYLTALKLYPETKHFGDACLCALAMEEAEGDVLSFDRRIDKVAGIQRYESL